MKAGPLPLPVSPLHSAAHEQDQVCKSLTPKHPQQCVLRCDLQLLVLLGGGDVLEGEIETVVLPLLLCFLSAIK